MARIFPALCALLLLVSPGAAEECAARLEIRGWPQGNVPARKLLAEDFTGPRAARDMNGRPVGMISGDFTTEETVAIAASLTEEAACLPTGS